jgi:ferredoxin-NADP reductase
MGNPTNPPVAPPTPRTVYNARIERIFHHNPDTRSLFLGVMGAERPAFVPGQFISIAIPVGDETRTRAYSIASSPEDAGPLEICFNDVPGGSGVRWLFERDVGDSLSFTGPFGTFTLALAPDCEMVFIAEGTCIAPIRPMIRRVIETPAHPPLFLLYGAPTADHILYRSEFESWARRDSGFAFETVTVGTGASEGAILERLHQEAERRWVSGDARRDRQFWICGVGKRVLSLRDLFRGSGYARRAVRYEQW